MPITATCPTCRRQYQYRDGTQGMLVCPKCDQILQREGSPPVQVVAQQAPAGFKLQPRQPRDYRGVAKVVWVVALVWLLLSVLYLAFLFLRGTWSREPIPATTPVWIITEAILVLGIAVAVDRLCAGRR